ncbi:MAG: transcriptional repressor, partial [Pseudomonadota bacterium]
RTKTVNSVLLEFQKEDGAIAVTDLVKRFKNKANKTTIYRILERLCEEEILHSFIGPNGLKWYAECHCPTHKNNDGFHPHFNCNECGKIKCIDFEFPTPKNVNVKIDMSEILLNGTCPNCH